jgi:hypothetical protein
MKQLLSALFAAVCLLGVAAQAQDALGRCTVAFLRQNLGG